MGLIHWAAGMQNVIVMGPAALLSLGLASGFLWALRADAPMASRRSAAFGIPALLLLFVLGAVWPSLFTLAAIASVPAFFVLGAAAFESRRLPTALRVYLAFAVLLSPLSYLAELVFLAR